MLKIMKERLRRAGDVPHNTGDVRQDLLGCTEDGAEVSTEYKIRTDGDGANDCYAFHEREGGDEVIERCEKNTPLLMSLHTCMICQAVALPSQDTCPRCNGYLLHPARYSNFCLLPPAAERFSFDVTSSKRIYTRYLRVQDRAFTRFGGDEFFYPACAIYANTCRCRHSDARFVASLVYAHYLHGHPVDIDDFSRAANLRPYRVLRVLRWINFFTSPCFIRERLSRVDWEKYSVLAPISFWGGSGYDIVYGRYLDLMSGGHVGSREDPARVVTAIVVEFMEVLIRPHQHLAAFLGDSLEHSLCRSAYWPTHWDNWQEVRLPPPVLQREQVAAEEKEEQEHTQHTQHTQLHQALEVLSTPFIPGPDGSTSTHSDRREEKGSYPAKDRKHFFDEWPFSSTGYREEDREDERRSGRDPDAEEDEGRVGQTFAIDCQVPSPYAPLQDLAYSFPFPEDVDVRIGTGTGDSRDGGQYREQPGTIREILAPHTGIDRDGVFTWPLFTASAQEFQRDRSAEDDHGR